MKARIIEHHKGDPRLSVPEWVVLTEVADRPGGAARYADAIAFNLWPSRGLAIHGFEVKVSRSDWLRELKDPAKAERIQSYCDYWWIAAPEDVVQDGELPDGWGLMVPNKGSRLRVVTRADKTDAKAIDRPFAASALRRAFQQSPVKASHDAALSAARREGQEEAKRTIEELKREIENVRRVIRQVNQGATGKTSGYGPLDTYKRDEELQALGRFLASVDEPHEMEKRARYLAEHVAERAERLLDEARSMLSMIDGVEANR